MTDSKGSHSKKIIDSFLILLVYPLKKKGFLMDVIFHGVRGSTPTADKNFLKYGGSTTCTEILHDEFQIICINLSSQADCEGKQFESN